MDSDDDGDDMCMAQRDWERMKNSLWKAGYREGIEKATEQSRQKYFDKAYNLSFQHSFKLGQIKGTIERMIEDSTCNKDLENLLSRINVLQQSVENCNVRVGDSFEDEVKAIQEKWRQEETDMLDEFKKFRPTEAEIIEKLWKIKSSIE